MKAFGSKTATNFMTKIPLLRRSSTAAPPKDVVLPNKVPKDSSPDVEARLSFRAPKQTPVVSMEAMDTMDTHDAEDEVEVVDLANQL